MKQTNHAVFIICNFDKSDEVMAIAKNAGAQGGTIIHARGTVSKETKKFFGIVIQPEKAIILILATQEDQEKIMNEVNDKADLTTDCHAVSFSMPISSYIGLSLENKKEEIENEQKDNKITETV